MCVGQSYQLPKMPGLLARNVAILIVLFVFLLCHTFYTTRIMPDPSDGSNQTSIGTFRLPGHSALIALLTINLCLRQVEVLVSGDAKVVNKYMQLLVLLLCILRVSFLLFWLALQSREIFRRGAVKENENTIRKKHRQQNETMKPQGIAWYSLGFLIV